MSSGLFWRRQLAYRYANCRNIIWSAQLLLNIAPSLLQVEETSENFDLWITKRLQKNQKNVAPVAVAAQCVAWRDVRTTGAIFGPKSWNE